VLDDPEETVGISSLAFTSKSDLLASGGLDGQIRIWDLRKKDITARFRNHSAAITAVTWNGMDSHIASASESGDIILHSLVSGVAVANFNQRGSRAVKCI
jgi:protein NEDD1